MDDVAAIRDQVAGVVVVAPLAQASGTAVRNAANWSTTVNGTTADYFTAQQWETASGRVFSTTEEQAGKAVCVIGSTVQRNLFRVGRPVGPALPDSRTVVRRDRDARDARPGRLRQ